MAKKNSDMNSGQMSYLSKFVICGGDEEPSTNIPTGYFNLDFAIHYGKSPNDVDLHSMEDYNPEKTLGLPLGKLVEFFGEEGSGKSYLAYRVCGNAQKLGYNVAWIDAEESFSKALAEINGCNVPEVQVISTAKNDMHAEDVIDMVVALCEAEKVPQMSKGKIIQVDAPRVIVVDSIAALVPKYTAENQSDAQSVAMLARILSQNIGKVTGAAGRNDVLVIFINQLREKVGLLYGNPEHSPGGHAVKHAVSAKIKITRRKNKEAQVFRIDDNGEERLIGCHSYVSIDKNRFGPPYKGNIDIPIYYEAYFPDIEDIIFDAGRQLKLISVRQGVYNFQGFKHEGRRNFIDKLKEENKIDEMVESIKAKAEEIGSIIPPEIQMYQKYENSVQNNKEVKVKNDSKEMETKTSRGRKRKDSSQSETNIVEPGGTGDIDLLED